MPLLQAGFDIRRYGFEPATTEVPGKLDIVYVVDADDAFTVVRPEDVERWGTTVEELHDVAVASLLRQTNEAEKLHCEPAGDQELCGWSGGRLRRHTDDRSRASSPDRARVRGPASVRRSHA